MTDAVLPSPRTLDLATDAAHARIRARYRAEARFKAYGLIAIGLTAVFLVVVLADIAIKGTPAFFQHTVVLDVKVDPAEVDPQGSRDPAVIRNGDFQALVRNTLRGMFPSVTDRPGRRLLDGIMSTGAATAGIPATRIPRRPRGSRWRPARRCSARCGWRTPSAAGTRSAPRLCCFHRSDPHPCRFGIIRPSRIRPAQQGTCGLCHPG